MIPKFRAWDKEYEDMHDVYCIDFHNKAVKTLDPMVGHCFWTTMQGKILMQSTGLTDRNGREIFEGDIIKATYHTVNDKGTEIEIVKVLGSVYFNYGAYYVDGYYFKELNNLEVIGNIFENPELREDTE
ncbi:YopX family protein [Abyssicoccus albus]|uniref:Putative phage protein (TIGR01671 family) n=1 Tax=Abyssicoccus albus TaxID=1817405 RepID=A0A3N5C8J0_9BACL|nr:YopX family protein [Abyssicoccus albus]RPF54785.1 putative phage protein (TIGR01671 family) [Abyssicoccus albus]